MILPDAQRDAGPTQSTALPFPYSIALSALRSGDCAEPPAALGAVPLAAGGAQPGDRHADFRHNDPVFVFGSKLAGRHGKGAALWARQHRGAIYGRGVGYQGNAYAIPTKNRDLRELPLPAIQRYVPDFIRFAQQRSDLRFELTPIGCDLAGYRTLRSHRCSPARPRT